MVTYSTGFSCGVDFDAFLVIFLSFHYGATSPETLRQLLQMLLVRYSLHNHKHFNNWLAHDEFYP